MYNKRELEKLELPALPSRKDDAVYRVAAIRYIIRCRYDQEHKLLIVAFFDREALANGFERPTAVLYQSKTEFVTRLQEHGVAKWRNGRILSVLNINSDAGVCLRISDEKTVRRFVPKKKTYNSTPARIKTREGDILTHLYTYQTWLQEQKNSEKKKERVRKTDTVMNTVPAVPAAFWRWADNMPMKHSRYMPYRRLNRTTAECTCTHCRTMSIMPAKEVRYGEAGTCPACGSAVTFKAAGRSHRIWDEGYSALLQQTRGGDFLLRFFQHTRAFYHGWESPEDTHQERARLLFTKEGVISSAYKYGSSSSLARCGWYPCKEQITGKNTKWNIAAGFSARVYNDWFEPSFLYPHNMRPMLGRLDLSYSLQKEWCHKQIDVTTTILQTARYPFAVRLADAGLDKLERDLYYDSEQLSRTKQTGSLHSCLCVPKELMPSLKAHNVTADVLNVLTRLPNPTADDIAYLNSIREPEPIHNLLDYTTMHKIKKYLAAQEAVQKKKGWYGNLSISWRDYLQMARSMGYDTRKKSILYPKDIMEEHDKLTQLKRVEYDPGIDQKIQSLYPSLERQYSFEDNDYLIAVPRDFEDFKMEGVTLLHCVCVNKYYLGHIAGSNLILFLRRQSEPEAPFYTIRYNPQSNQILECEGYRHKRAEDGIKAFTDKWRRFIAHRRFVAAETAEVA